MEALKYRAIQIGLSNEAIVKYVNEWITDIVDFTQVSNEIYDFVRQKRYEDVNKLLPNEVAYPLEENISL